MSILIKCMEMPTSCYKCQLRRRDGMDIVCPIAHERFSVADVNILEYRLDNCPLVPVPQHGRLIDADEMARKDNDDFLKIMEMSAPSTVLATALADAHTAIQEMLKNAPTIIPAEEGE